jgi:hypothetical protein
MSPAMQAPAELVVFQIARDAGSYSALAGDLAILNYPRN